REYQVKAAFLFNFTQFVEWPVNIFASDQSPLIIGVLGENPFGNYLQEAITGEAKDGHPLTIKYYKDISEVTDCHILFINLPTSKKIEQLLEECKKRHILTVSDVPGFINQGGMVFFINKNNKIHIKVNIELAKEADLTISSKLLRLVEIVNYRK